jgi:sulfatase maturation enzyme AslB (radical SAM superfamily)
MISYEQITRLHLELSTLCNARCPLCPRNFYGYPYNDGYPEVNLTLSQVQKIFTESFLNQLTTITIEGNFGDATMNPETIDIIEYFRKCNGDVTIIMHTNGFARDEKFWEDLADLKVKTLFALDGLEDTHDLYRQDTDYKKILKNAETFINKGGYAVWWIVPFDHNEHQIDQCRQLSTELGFKEFDIHDESRNSGPVYNKHGNLVNVLGSYDKETNFAVKFHAKTTDLVLVEDIVRDRTPKSEITCQSTKNKQIYVSANGEVSPCCFMGFYPRTYGHGSYHQAINKQISDIVYKNNTLEYPLEECLEWFNSIEKRWKISSYDQGRLVVCDDNCGSN